MCIQIDRTEDVRHEFGHLVVAKALRFETGSIEILPDQAKAHIMLKPNLKSMDDVAQYGRKRIQVLYGGAGAQALDASGIVDGNRAKLLLGTTAINDHAKIRELLRIVSAIEHPEAESYDDRGRVTTTIDTDLRLKTGALIESNSKLIVALTKFLLTRMGLTIPFTLPAKEIDEFPGISQLTSGER
jgi:hypothetical protein